MNWNAFKRLFHYLGRYKLRLILVMIAVKGELEKIREQIQNIE